METTEHEPFFSTHFWTNGFFADSNVDSPSLTVVRTESTLSTTIDPT
jgi:hypothetical protein